MRNKRFVVFLSAMVLIALLLIIPRNGGGEDKDASKSQETLEEQIGAFEFEVKFPSEVVRVDFSNAENFTCVTQDSSNSQLKGIARIKCTLNNIQIISETGILAIIEVKPAQENDTQSAPFSSNGGNRDTNGWLIAALAGIGLAAMVGFGALKLRTRRS